MSTFTGKSVRDRRSFIGGFIARIIMGDDEAALARLWKEKRGEVDPEDWSGDLLVQLGTATEQLNRRWYEKNTEQVDMPWAPHTQRVRLPGLRRRTPCPPPFSSMNSTPALSRARCILAIASSDTVRRSRSKSTTVDKPIFAAVATCGCVISSSALALRH